MESKIGKIKEKVAVYISELDNPSSNVSAETGFLGGILNRRKDISSLILEKDLKKDLYELNLKELVVLRKDYEDKRIKALIDRVLSVKRNILYRLKLVPIYTKTSLFFIGLTFLSLLSLSDGMRTAFFHTIDAIGDDHAQGIPSLLFWIALGFLASIYFIFSKRKFKAIDGLVKTSVFIYAVLVNGVAAMYASYHVISGYISSGQGLLWMILPAINALNAIIIMGWIGRGDSQIWAIKEEGINFRQLFIGGIIIFLIIFLSHFIFENHWAITFSLATIYGVNLSNLFFVKRNKSGPDSD